MACKHCVPDINKFDIKDLSEDHVCNCSICGKIIEFSKYKDILALPYYKGNIFNLFYKSDYLNYRKIIKKYASYLGFQNMKFKGEEISSCMWKILGLMLDDLNKIIDKNTQELMIVIYSWLEYSTFLTQDTVVYLDQLYQDNLKPLASQDEIANRILQILYTIRNTDVELFSQMYKTWEEFLTLEKLAFQRVLQMCTRKIIKSKLQLEQTDRFIININKVEEILDLCRFTNELLLTCEQIKENLIRFNEIKFDGSGSIEFIEDDSNVLSYKDIADQYIKTMSNVTPTECTGEDHMIIDKIDEISKKYIGIEATKLPDLSEKITDVFYLNDKFLIGNKECFIRLIEKIVNIGTEKATTLFDLLSPAESISCGSMFEFIHSERAMRKCLLPITDDVFICPVSMLKTAFGTIYLDILNNIVDNDDFKNELKKPTKDMDLAFEVQIMNKLIEQIPDIIIKHNVEQNSIKDIYKKSKSVSLPGQIDLLIIYKDILIVVDCKNLDLKLTTKEMKSELLHFYGHVKKLENKINTIQNNWESTAMFMNIEGNKISKEKVRGLFVTRTVSIGSTRLNYKYPIVSAGNLVDYIKQLV
ncbi:hypothetical protein OSC52_14445 [Clostridium pasteurianum]|uniref:hypothetical protein n=1 Tax=Clostridium pasteurianum TaxID=1501 RepID=UPI0022608945|nr:hypothetical protein [Clostridium pasteurianum]UZW13042.1 hypothetical protein OSC52_14445 [Clostridium pasteurianum]